MRSPQLLQRVLVADPTLAAWDARRRHEMALTFAIRNKLPRQLAARIRVVGAERETLEIVADSGAVAAAVRQRLPTVLARLVSDGCEFTAIRVRVQVRTDAAAPAKSPRNALDKSTVATLEQFAETLSPGPLKVSLDRLLRRAR